MERFEVRWRNFRSFEDTGWLDIRPVTIIIGPNGSGKTSVLAPLLLLKQTLQSLDPALPLKPVGDLFNGGSFLDLLPYHDPASDVTLAIRFHHHDPEEGVKIGPLGEHPPGELEVSLAWQKGTSTPILSRYVVRDVFGRQMLGRTRLRSGRYSLSGVHRAALRTQAVIRTASPQHFLFTGDEIFRSVFEPIGRRKRHDDRVRGPKVKPNKPTFLYLSIVSVVVAKITVRREGWSKVHYSTNPDQEKRLHRERRLAGRLLRGFVARISSTRICADEGLIGHDFRRGHRHKRARESLIKLSLSTASTGKVAPDEAEDTGDDDWV